MQATAGPLPEQILWLIYECAFAALALWWRARVVPARRPPAERFLRAVLAYVAVYYALWALADVLILAGWDVGWALRVLPNQLYYAFWVPVVWALFFSPRYAATSSVGPDAQVAQAARRVGAPRVADHAVGRVGAQVGIEERLRVGAVGRAGRARARRIRTRAGVEREQDRRLDLAGVVAGLRGARRRPPRSPRAAPPSGRRGR